MKWKKYYKEDSHWLDDRMDEYGITIKQIKEFYADEWGGGLYDDAVYLIDNYMDETYGRYGDYTDEELEEITNDIGFRCVVVFYETDEYDYPEKTTTTDYFNRILFILDKDGNVLDWDDYGEDLDDDIVDALRKKTVHYIKGR